MRRGAKRKKLDMVGRNSFRKRLIPSPCAESAVANVMALTVGVTLLALSGCGYGDAPRAYPEKPDSGAAYRALELYDANKDGFLDAKELENVPGLKAAMGKIDVTHSGKISASDIATRIKAWSDSKIVRTTVICQVLHNGRPLPGATVRFVPESFLGGNFKATEGITDAQGRAKLKNPISGERGVCPGLYRIEVTKSGEAIPRKYNAETLLGQEVAQDAAGLQNCTSTIDLKY
jgi:hypothetical protein